MSLLDYATHIKQLQNELRNIPPCNPGKAEEFYSLLPTE
jgi:hypothetical protein